MDTGMTARLQRLWAAPRAVVASIVALLTFIFVVVGVCLITVWVGVPILVSATATSRKLAEGRRRQIEHVTGEPIPSPYLRTPDGGPLVRLAALVQDPAVRRDQLWVFVSATLGLALSIVALAEAVLDIVFWWLPFALADKLRLRVDRSLLVASEKSRLAQRVEQLTESRAETVDTQAAELRRIERDLHDGAQARLVALGMSLAMAEQLLERNPDEARALLTEARTASSDALAELRDLVRGIHPPVLADRGLVGAVQALGLAAPIPVTVQTQVGRLPAPVESAAYFAVAEALTNVVKHAGARHADVRLTADDDQLTIVVRDDGVGGADPAGGTGLRGIERRLSAFDGTLTVESPSGGPTEVVMVLPCASSSPKTSPSSGTV